MRNLSVPCVNHIIVWLNNDIAFVICQSVFQNCVLLEILFILYRNKNQKYRVYLASILRLNGKLKDEVSVRYRVELILEHFTTWFSHETIYPFLWTWCVIKVANPRVKLENQNTVGGTVSCAFLGYIIQLEMV